MRLQTGLTQRALALSSGVGRVAIARLESGESSAHGKTAARLAAALMAAPVDLCGEYPSDDPEGRLARSSFMNRAARDEIGDDERLHITRAARRTLEEMSEESRPRSVIESMDLVLEGYSYEEARERGGMPPQWDPFETCGNSEPEGGRTTNGEKNLPLRRALYEVTEHMDGHSVGLLLALAEKLCEDSVRLESSNNPRITNGERRQAS